MAISLTGTQKNNVYKIITSTGEVLEFKEFNAASRVMFDINNKKQSICYQNVGFGPDTNTLYFGRGLDHIEYGNLTEDKVRESMKNLLNRGWLDLSGVKIIDNLSKIKNDEVYLYSGYDILDDKTPIFTNIDKAPTPIFKNIELEDIYMDISDDDNYFE